MTTPLPEEPVVPADKPLGGPANGAAAPAVSDATVDPAAGANATSVPETTVQTVEEQVVLQRSVRYPRLMITGLVVGAVLGAIVTLFFPVSDDYTIWQVMGFIALVGATLGLALGAVLALILDKIVSRKRGTATAVRIITHDAD
ncbi:MFS transporter [Lysinibacter cavernae]|uniref:MFS family permease n=1 Tax=Lysinibacter cavernae TaxID=1640652 RepID=A0A7X5TU17_9MICO|nr:MFS transporter [Lysinibacter cavernae]NIH53903.1 MFS family permease [Lysinibacter cavernae]